MGFAFKRAFEDFYVIGQGVVIAVWVTDELGDPFGEIPAVMDDVFGLSIIRVEVIGSALGDDAVVMVTKGNEKAFLPILADVFTEGLLDNAIRKALFDEEFLGDAGEVSDDFADSRVRSDVALEAFEDFLNGQVVLQKDLISPDLDHLMGELGALKV